MTMRRTAWVLAAAAGMFATAAVAHHGWNWAEDEQTELEGTIREIYIGPPHPELRVEVGDGAMWRIELGNPRLTARSGFVEGVASPGDTILVRGHRALDQSDVHMKAVRITIDGVKYDIYPDRIEP
jgi:hypothetical protein